MEAIEAGDVVVLKSGSPDMTVRWVEAGEAFCEWFDGKGNKGAVFLLLQLKKSRN